ncbi:formimidoylglutamase [Flavobacteriaceae bacterium R38]|nr:formimidoylglutamase [Flavobacteriaceae bacterium R38]
MEERREIMNKSLYKSSGKNLWKGRETDPSLGAQYWYQKIECLDLNEYPLNSDSKNKEIGIIGYACDEGVRRNQGRVGAFSAPFEIRKKLAKIALHFDNKRIVDFGDIICEGNDMEACQDELSTCVSSMLNHKILPIVMGGGHDIAYGHFMGIKDALNNFDKKKIGIINFDAHFDLRPFEEQGNSGTPFNQINAVLNTEKKALNYFVLGIQQQANTRELFQIADKLGVQYLLNEECHLLNIEKIKEELTSFIEANDCIYLTIDMDGFSSAYAPGVSAPSSLGMEPLFVLELLKHIFKSDKVVSCDIAELNPTYDIDGITASLAARLIDAIVQVY